ncbi:carbohydrate ABC transporter permease [Paenibacillus sp.]|uniref:carbohydrate ABC transporter permease n=1 Tax=Paenibacillus sp. TaxID=58172 RepID=UPI002811F38C|nr:carbohydrate ABC transporter permease [Paenibacillus sp.]
MLYRSTSDRLLDTVNIVLLIWIAGMMFFPFLYIFSVSFSSMRDYLEHDFLLWPKTWVTDAYQYILGNNRFIRSVFVSLFITAAGTLLNLLFTTTMAYGLSRPFFGQRTMIFMVLFTFLFSPGIIPTYLIVKETGLIDSLWSLIIPVLVSPWNMIVMRQFFRNLPEELTEAATMDGANPITVFTRVILPLSKPALATFGLFYAVAHWNSYFSGLLYINNPSNWPIQVLLRQIVIVNDNTALLEQQGFVEAPPAETIQMAAILLATVPILVVYPFLQKHFAKGVMLGSVKG